MSASRTKSVVRLRVNGMRCHSCELKLTAWMRDIPHVDAVDASYESGYVTVYTLDDVPIDAMLKAIVDAGFTAGLCFSNR